MHRAKQLSGYYGKRVADSRIWQPGYFDRVLGETEDTRQVVAYVLLNPVRKGPVAKPEDYSFSGSGLETLKELVESVRGRGGISWLLIPHAHLDVLGDLRYRLT